MPSSASDGRLKPTLRRDLVVSVALCQVAIYDPGPRLLPRPAPPAPGQGQADQPRHEERLIELAAPDVAIGEGRGTAGHHAQARGEGDQRHDPRVEEIRPEGLGEGPERPEQRTDE